MFSGVVAAQISWLRDNTQSPAAVDAIYQSWPIAVNPKAPTTRKSLRLLSYLTPESNPSNGIYGKKSLFGYFHPQFYIGKCTKSVGRENSNPTKFTKKWLSQTP